MNEIQLEIVQELWDRHGEYLEMLPDGSLDGALVPILASMVAKERAEKDLLRKRLEMYEYATRINT